MKKNNKGQKLWKKSLNIIPSGNMLFSKKSELFLPNKWPSYYESSKGVNIWDLDGKKLNDLSFAVGTNILGYCNDEVDKSVKSIIDKGTMTTLNCYEEVHLAEKLIELHSWAGMVKFARSGGEANSIAIRIARAASGKDKVAICGYHGWHDWYLSANISNINNLNEHHLPSLSPIGVPKSLKNNVFAFKYEDIESLKELISNHPDIGTIKMEVSRNTIPNKKFLKEVRVLANKNNMILIFDECTSGFRQTFGGIHKIYDIEPDMAMFGKALGNGYAITAVIGKKEIMKHASNTFISSTFWTERIGPTAALKTLEVMQQIKSWEILTKKGKKIKKGWFEIFKQNHLDVSIQGIDSLPNFYFKSNKHLYFKTYITQEMLKKGFLASNLIFVSISHTDEIIDQYFDHLNNITKILSNYLEEEKKFDLLDDEVCQSEFKRLN